MRDGKGAVWVWVLVAGVLLLCTSKMMMIGYVGPPPTKAPEIISNLRTLKTAMLYMYADFVDSVDQQGRIDGQVLEDFIVSDEGQGKLKGYMQSDALTIKAADAQEGEYLVASDQESGRWFIGYRLEGKTDKDKRTRRELARRAQSLGLLMYAKKESPLYAENSGYVWWLVR